MGHVLPRRQKHALISMTHMIAQKIVKCKESGAIFTISLRNKQKKGCPKTALLAKMI
jgi:hypothetical protein